MDKYVLTPIAKKPDVITKTNKKNNLKELIESFIDSETKIAQIEVKDPEKILGVRISIGRIVNKLKKTNSKINIETYESKDHKYVILEKK